MNQCLNIIKCPTYMTLTNNLVVNDGIMITLQLNTLDTTVIRCSKYLVFIYFETALLAEQVKNIIGEHLLENKDIYQSKINLRCSSVEQYVENMGQFYPNEIEIEAFCKIYSQRCILIQQGTKLVRGVFGNSGTENILLEVSPFREYSNIKDDTFYGQLAYIKLINDQQQTMQILKEFQKLYWTQIYNKDVFHNNPITYQWNPDQPSRMARTYSEETISVTQPLQVVQCYIIEVPQNLKKYLVDTIRYVVHLRDVYSKYKIIRPLPMFDSQWLLPYIQIFAFQFGFMEILQVDNSCIFKDGRINSWCNDHGIVFKYNLSKESKEHQKYVSDELIQIYKKASREQKLDPLQKLKVDLCIELEIFENEFNHEQNAELYGHVPNDVIRRPKQQLIFNTDDYDIDIKHEQLKQVYNFDMLSKQQMMQFRQLLQSLELDDDEDSSDEMPIKTEIKYSIQKSIRKLPAPPKHRLKHIDSN